MASPQHVDLVRTTFAERTRVLLVDADPASLRVATTAVATAGGEVVRAAAPHHDIAGVSASLVILDIPDRQTLPLVDRFLEAGMTVIATSASGSVALAVEAMRRGAVDFVLKPYTPDSLAQRLASRFVSESPAAPAQAVADAGDFCGFLGASQAMRALYAEIERVAPSRAAVFVTGESGAGKELCAEAIHARSGRGAKPLVALNCGAIPRELMESEVFGHVRGAFTGATEDRVGAVEAAAGGTLFLDEIGEMELGLQAKLLRVLQTGEFRRVGDPRARQADARIVCATHRDPLMEVAAGRFRQDLFYRLHVLPLRIPPLRARGEDVVTLADAFLRRYSDEEGRPMRRLSPGAAARIRAYPWPGNVRELQNVIRRAVVFGEGAELTEELLPPEFFAAPPLAPEPGSAGAVEPFWIEERRIIERAIAAFDGNTAKAAAALEISPSTIYRKRERWAELDA